MLNPRYISRICYPFSNNFVSNSNVFGSPGSRYLFVHGLLEVGLVLSLIMPWHQPRR